MGFSNVVLAQVSPPPVPDGPWHMIKVHWGPTRLIFQLNAD
jgi:hypothetical protein